MNGAVILRQGTQGRERCREKINLEVSFGLLGVEVLMGDSSGDSHLAVESRLHKREQG